VSVVKKCSVRYLLCAFGLLAAASGHSQDWLYSVRPGDNLWELSKSYLKQVNRWSDLQRLNRIKDPRGIPPGTLIRIPIAWLKHQPVPARIVEVRGTVKAISDPSRPPLSLVPGSELRVGDRIETGPDSSATIQFADQSLLLVQAETTLVFDTLSAFGKSGMVDTRLRIQRGRLESQVVPAKGPASRYQVITPAAVTAVRGTSFRIAATATSGTTRAEVMKGRVEVEASGVRRLVPTGFGIIAEVGKPPSEPQKLLAAPDLSRLPSVVKRLPLTFEWPQVDTARSYRAQIFADSAFRKLLVEQQVQRPRAAWAELADGHYMLRIRAIDDVGLEGLNADWRFVLDTGPAAPRLLKPRDGAKLRALPPVLSWATSTSVAGVRLQVARDPEFNHVVLEIAGYAPSSLMLGEALSPGLYYWRLASQRANGDEGPFSASRQFHLQPLPLRPQFRQSTVKKRRLHIEWAATAHAVRYRCQFAKSATFVELIEEQVVKEPHCHTGRLSPGIYYGRAQGISVDGMPGPFSKGVPVEIKPPDYVPFTLLGLLLLLLILL
jgi:hypothetical protein